MGDHISWHVELQVKPGQMAAFRALTLEMVQATKTERGTLIYERFIAHDNEAVHVFERYSDSAAAAAHLRTFAQMYGKRFADLLKRSSQKVALQDRREALCRLSSNRMVGVLRN